MSKINERQKKFCEFYAKTGNATQSYKDAGYKPKDDASAAVSSANLLTNVKVIAFLNKLQQNTRSEAIASIAEVKEFWTKVMLSDEEETPHRVKAGELLVKSQGGFIEKKEVKHSGDAAAPITFIPVGKDD